MKTKVCKVILMFVLVMGFSLCLLNGKEQWDHWWKFNETSGSIAHDSRGNVDGKLSNATFLPDGGGVQLTASGDSYVSFGKSVGQFGTNDFEVTLEFKTSNEKNAYDLVGNRTATFGSFFQVHIAPGGIVVATVNEENKKFYIWLRYDGKSYADGQWHTVKVRRTGATMALYIDEMGKPVKEGSAPAIANINNGSEFKLGHSTVDNWISPADIVCKNLKISVN